MPKDDRDDDEDEGPRLSRPRTGAVGSTSPRRALVALALVPLALCCVCGTGAALGRGAVARYLARSLLAGHGITCGAGFDVTPDASFAHAEIAPCTCTMEDGAIESFELVEPVTVDLDGQTVTHVHAGSVRLALRGAGPSVDAASLGPIASAMGVPARIGGVVNAAARIAEASPPPIEATHVEVDQGGRPAVTLDGLALDGGHPLAITVHEVALPSLTGPLGAHATATIDDVSGTATPSEVHIEGQLSLSGAAPIMGTVTRSGTVTVSGTGIGSESPTYRIEL